MIDTITDRQLEIIESAGKILTLSGVSGLTIKNLAKEMKFSESAIYRHFSSKEEIVITLLEYLADKLDERYTRELTSDLNTKEKFETLFRNLFIFFNNNPHFVVAVFSDGIMDENERINAAILKIMAVKMKHLMPIIKGGQQMKVFTDAIPAEDLLHIVMGSIRLQMYKWRAANFQFDNIVSGDKLIQSLLTIIKQ